MFASLMSFFTIVAVLWGMYKCAEFVVKSIGNFFGIHSAEQAHMTFGKCMEFRAECKAGNNPSWMQLANDLSDIRSK